MRAAAGPILKCSVRAAWILALLAAVARPSSASRFNGPFWYRWDKSSIVAACRVGAPVTYAHDRRAAYPVEIIEVFKGAEAAADPLYAVDLYYRSSASLFLMEGRSYLLFLGKGRKDEELRMPFGLVPGHAYKCLSLYPWGPQTEGELRDAVKGIRRYQGLASRDEKVRFLLAQLEEPNSYLVSLVHREVMILKVKEAIPHFEKLLSSESETTRLGAARILRNIGYPKLCGILLEWLADPSSESEATRLEAAYILRDIGYPKLCGILLEWLADPRFQKKGAVISELERLGDKSAVPAIKRFADCDDERLRAEAGRALLRLGDPDGKRVLFDILARGSDGTARHNAIYSLRWGARPFSPEERDTLEKLSADEDEAVRRLAGLILDETK